MVYKLVFGRQGQISTLLNSFNNYEHVSMIFMINHIDESVKMIVKKEKYIRMNFDVRSTFFVRKNVID